MDALHQTITCIQHIRLFVVFGLVKCLKFKGKILVLFSIRIYMYTHRYPIYVHSMHTLLQHTFSLLKYVGVLTPRTTRMYPVR